MTVLKHDTVCIRVWNSVIIISGFSNLKNNEYSGFQDMIAGDNSK